LHLAFKTTVILPSRFLSLFPFQSSQYCLYGKSTVLSVVAPFISFVPDESWLRIHFLSFWFRSWPGVCGKPHASHLQTFSFRVWCGNLLKIWTRVLHSAPLNVTAAICQKGGCSVYCCWMWDQHCHPWACLFWRCWHDYESWSLFPKPL